jgi:hypothetical protein
MKTLKEMIDDLEQLAVDNTCDGSCDAERPHKRCKNCEATNAINDAYEIIYNMHRRIYGE